jgi:hypothetical protein
MPIEIRELVIRVAVDEQSKKTGPQPDLNELNALKNKLIKECMETILLKIDNRSDR